MLRRTSYITRKAPFQFLSLAAGLLLAVGAVIPARAQDPDDLKRGVARISLMDGEVSVRRGDSGEWVAGVINAPLLTDDRIATGQNSRAEVEFDSANILRIGGNAEIHLVLLESATYRLEIARGTVTFRVLRPSSAAVELNTPSVSVRPTREGTFRISVNESGETEITASKGKIRELVLVPHDVEPLPQTLEAIANADLITIGPGSLFTSLIPNLLVRGISHAIAESPAIKVFICNLMTQVNESLSLSASEHIKALNEHAGVQLFDYALINSKEASPEMKAKYALEGASQIAVDLEAIEALGVCPILGEYLDEGEVARHATDRVAHDLMALMAQAPDGQAIRS